MKTSAFSLKCRLILKLKTKSSETMMCRGDTIFPHGAKAFLCVCFGVSTLQNIGQH